MPSLSRGGDNSYFEGDMPPKKKTPKSGANIGAIAGDLLTIV
jgi:hypothetical protein